MFFCLNIFWTLLLNSLAGSNYTKKFPLGNLEWIALWVADYDSKKSLAITFIGSYNVTSFCLDHSIHMPFWCRTSLGICLTCAYGGLGFRVICGSRV